MFNIQCSANLMSFIVTLRLHPEVSFDVCAIIDQITLSMCHDSWKTPSYFWIL